MDFQHCEVILVHQLPKRGPIKKTRKDHSWLHQSSLWQHGEGRSDMTTTSCKALRKHKALLSSGGRSIPMGEMELALTLECRFKPAETFLVKMRFTQSNADLPQEIHSNVFSDFNGSTFIFLKKFASIICHFFAFCQSQKTVRNSMILTARCYNL
jgi:hypothetical protein